MFLSSFRSRLFVISVTLLAVFVAGVGIYLHQVLRTWTVAVIEEDLQVRAQLVADALELAPEEMDYQKFVDTFDVVDDQRITIVAKDGTLLADTHLSVTQRQQYADFIARPEVVDALSEESGTHSVTRRYSESIDQEMLNVALPAAGGEVVVRVSVPLRELEEVIAGLHALLIIGGVIGIAGTILISGIASRLMSQILQDVLDRARADEALKAAPRPLSQTLFSTHDNSLRAVTEALEDTLEELAEQRNRFRAVLNGMDEGVLATDDELRITLSNRTVRQLLGLHAEPEGRLLSESLSVELVELLVERTGESFEFEVSEPTPRRIQVGATRRPEDTGYIFVFHDVTTLRHLESLRRDFVANVSHELRTPVAVIQANSQTLLNGAIDSPKHARSFTEGIYRNSRRLGRLVADLLDLARLEAGETDLNLQDTRLTDVLCRVVDDVTAFADVDESVITHNVDSGLEVRADSEALGQVVGNLLENALKYGGDDVQIVVNAYRDEDQVVVEVIDDGPGVPEEHRRRIFERFHRVEEGRMTKSGGTGLGLSIVKHLVKAMDGEVGCRERCGGGAVFWFTLPVA